MTRNERQDLALLAGIVVLLIGIWILYGAINNTWSVGTALSNTAGLIVGGFTTVIGVVVIGAALDVLDDLSYTLQNIWDSFLGAIGRSE